MADAGRRYDDGEGWRRASRPGPLTVRLFGGPLLLGEDGEIPLSPYQFFLLVLVYGHGRRGLPRTRAARLLWGSELDRRARHRLSQLIHAIHLRAGGRVVIERRGERLLPPAGGVVCDLLPDTPRRNGEAALPSGEDFLPLLPGDLPSRGFEEWLHALRVSQERRRDGIGDPAAPEPAEPASGDPLPRPTPVPRDAPLIGRRAELEAALAALSSGSRGWTTVVLSGEAGMGKTRLLEEIRASLEGEGTGPAMVRCHEAERHVSFNLLGDLLDATRLARAVPTLSQPWRSIVETTFPGAAGPSEASPESVPPAGSAPGPRRVFDALERLFAAAVPDVPLVALVDDFHWTDPGSAAALGFLRRRLPLLRVRFVLTVPAEVVQLDHPGSAYLRGLDATQDAWIALEGMSPAEISELLAGRSPGPVADEELREISALSGGVPLFAIELASERSEGKRSAQASRRSTTTSAEALFRRREGLLSPSARHLLRLLAVFGRPVSREVLGVAAGMGPSDLAPALVELDDHRLAAELGDGRIDTRHDLIRGAVHRGLRDSARRRYHRAVAEGLLASDPTSEAGELAGHFHRAREPFLAHRYATLAADAALKKGALQESRHMLELAAETAGDPSRRFSSLDALGHLCQLQGHHASAARHMEDAATCAASVGDVTSAARSRIHRLAALVELGERGGSSAQEEIRELAAEALRQGWMAIHLEAMDLAIRVADYGFDAPAARSALLEVDALDVSGEGPAVRCLRESIRTRHVLYGSPEQAVLSARGALRIAGEHGLAAEYGRAVKRFLVVLGYLGLLDGEEGRRLIEDARVVFQRTGDQSALFDVLINFGVWLVDTGRYQAAEEYLRQAGRIVHNLEDAPEYAVFTCNMGELYLYQADYLTAKRYFRRAWEKGGPTRRATRCAVAGGLGLCSVQTGDLGLVDELESALPPDDALLGNPSIDPTPVALFRARRLEIRQSPDAAARLLHRYAESVRDRIVPAWMKILLAELRLRRKHNLGGLGRLAEEGRETAERLGLDGREREFAAFAGARAGSPIGRTWRSRSARPSEDPSG